MTAVLMADCIGLWRRTLLVDADGSRDTSTDVRWLQGITAYVDSRGFGGRLSQRGDIFEWSHFASVLPADVHPDAGRMRWHGDTLIEVGVHADYIEHWQRDAPAPGPCWSLTLRGADGEKAVLMRVGDDFGWLRRGAAMNVYLGQIDGPDWIVTSHENGHAFRPTLHAGDLIVDGMRGVRRWRVQESEGTVKL